MHRRKKINTIRKGKHEIIKVALYLGLAALLVSAGYLYYQNKTASQSNHEALVSDTPLPEGISVELESLENEYSKTGTTEILNNAIEKFNSEDFNGALELFLKISDTDRRGTAGAGLAYVKLEKYESAVTYLESALAMGEDKFIVRKFLSFAYYMINELEMSARNAKAALAMNEEDDLRKFYKKILREQRNQENFINSEIIHFKVMYDGDVHSDISGDILNILEDAYSDIGGKIMHYPDIKITVILYSQKDFSEVTMLPAWVKGSYDGKIRLPIKDVKKNNVAVLKNVIYHEYVHALIHAVDPKVPLWINEGLAEYLVPRGLERINQVIRLRDLEHSFPLEDEQKVSIAYRVSFSAISYLVEKYGIFAIRDLLKSLGQGETLNKAFEFAFFITYDEFVSTWGRKEPGIT